MLSTDSHTHTLPTPPKALWGLTPTIELPETKPVGSHLRDCERRTRGRRRRRGEKERERERERRITYPRSSSLGLPVRRCAVPRQRTKCKGSAKRWRKRPHETTSIQWQEGFIGDPFQHAGTLCSLKKGEQPRAPSRGQTELKYIFGRGR